ncbi:MAG: hypothetical protein JO117_08370 [Verrucomicrobia bacterium]|nr:hypothetical protein [Verrucomicrobiota bacterium]MBV9658972.1 hypothetical protein [Verrucomicrobiota bacterium]
MWTQFYSAAKQVLELVDATRQNGDDIKKLRSELDTLADTVQNLAFGLQRLRDEMAHDREIFNLKLENEFLRRGYTASAPKPPSLEN